MTSIDPTLRLAQTRSLIDSVQQEIEQLEGLMADFLEREGSESSTTSTNARRSSSDIKNDFKAWQDAKNELTPTDQLDVLREVAYDAGFIRDQHGAWSEFSEESGSSAVTRQAIAVLKASLGALRVEESYWNTEQQEQQKMQKSSNEIAKL